MEKFYAMTKSSVYGFALFIVKNHEIAEDIMQDTYIRVFQYGNNYYSKNKPMAWLLTIVKNLSFTRLQHKSEKELPLEDEWLSKDKDFSEASLDKILLNKVMKSLTDEECQIVILNSLVGLKHREIAELLDLPLSTTLSKYYRSLSKLRKMLKEEAN